MWLEINRKWRTRFSKLRRMRSGPSSDDKLNTTNLFVSVYGTKYLHLLINELHDRSGYHVH
jgi:hypothetical protein